MKAKRRWTKHRGRTTGAGAWVAGLAIAAGATALLVTMMPSARRYMRMRAM